MSRKIESVAVLGAGTMGTGIAAVCATEGIRVLMLDVTAAAAALALEKVKTARPPMLDDVAAADLITTGSLADDLARIADYDWICEAVIEDLQTKRELFARLEPLRRAGSVVSTNTSGIPLRSITDGLPASLHRDIAVTHFFNPVKMMRLMELIPGEQTTADVIRAFKEFCGGRLGKGVVHAKDTVNFIGNRIGCFWMLSGLHKAKVALLAGVNMETIDAAMSKPVGLPPTGLYGLIDLIGLDVMDLVGKNLEINLPPGDPGRAYTRFPAPEMAMLERGQLGRKTGGGFYRRVTLEDGSRSREVFDLTTEDWRAEQPASLPAGLQESDDLMFSDEVVGQLAWDLMGGALCYAADRVPEISDDIVNIDRAMRWGFAWRRGPFEMLDALGTARVADRLAREGKTMPRMLRVLAEAGAPSFYRADGAEYLGFDGDWHRTAPE